MNEKLLFSCLNCLDAFSSFMLIWGQFVSHMCKYAVFSLSSTFSLPLALLSRPFLLLRLHVFMRPCFVGDELSARRRQAESLKPAATICLSFSRFITLPVSQAIDSFLHLRLSIASCFHPVKSAEIKMNLFFYFFFFFLLTDLQRICVLTTTECH